MDVQVIVTTWGHPSWAGMASRVAIPSVGDQAPVRHYHHEGEVSAGAARNKAVWTWDPQEWICFLDADDELEPGYIDAMRRANFERNLGPRLLLTPKLRLGDDEPTHFADRNIITGLNPCPIGTLIHRSTFDAVGGFWDEPAWEDWSLFRRAVLNGSTIAFVDAVYKANSTSNGRNSTVRNPRLLRKQIIQSHDRWMNR